MVNAMPGKDRGYRLRWVDVFTDRALAGNPLAVVLQADGLSTTQMQAIARETNLSETTFVLPPEKREHAAKVRIFTPHVELPFAGHPTVGTGWVLLDEGFGKSGCHRVHARGRGWSDSGKGRPEWGSHGAVDDAPHRQVR